MKGASILLSATIGVATVSMAFEFTGSLYVDRTIQFQLGDVCDSARFPLTPGTCAGDQANPDWRTEFSAAADRWNSATDLFEVTTDAGTGASTPGSCVIGDLHSTFFLADACGIAFGETTLAIARTQASFSSLTGETRHSDIVFNTAHDWGAFDGSFAQNPGLNDFRRTAVHEIGHVMGLNHPYHSDAIMYFATQSGVIAPMTDDLSGLNALYGHVGTYLAPDFSGNSEQELVFVRTRDDASAEVEVRDGATGTLLRTMAILSDAFDAVDAAVLGDLDSNGFPEIAVLARRNSDGRTVVEISNLGGSASPRLIWFAAGAMARRIAVVPDADGNGVDEIAVLSVRDSDVRAFVEVKNAFGATAPNTIWAMRFATTIDLAVIDDADGNGIAEVAVLSQRWLDGRGVVEIKNAAGATSPNTVWAMSGVSPLRLTTIDDADSNGVPEVGILSQRNSDGRIVVEVKNAAGATQPNALWYASGSSARAVTQIADADGNGIPEVAVLMRRLSDGRVFVELKNASGQTLPNTLWFPAGFSPAPDILTPDDTDGNTVPEIAVLLHRTTDGRLAVQQRNANGSQLARTTWATP